MKRWVLWYLLAPQAWLLAGLWRDLGLPPLDAAVFACLFLGMFVERSAVPFLLVPLAVGRALVDPASLPVHLLVLGVPVAVLLPLRGVFHRQWFALAILAAALGVVVPRLGGLLGRWFEQPSAGGYVEPAVVLWSAVAAPIVLHVAMRLPPMRSFGEPS